MSFSITKTIIVVLASLVTVGAAQNDPQPPVGTITKQLFPDGAGGNGYADLVLAGEHVKSSQPFQQLADKLPKATLAEKRRALTDPPVVKALELLRRGIAQKIESRTRTSTRTRSFQSWLCFGSSPAR